jgi:hypothetical protein
MIKNGECSGMKATGSRNDKNSDAAKRPSAATCRQAGEPPLGAWQHPTGRRPKSVAVVALGPSSMQWHAGSWTYDRAHGKPDEVWTVNKGLRTIRCDLAFVMDDLVGEGRRSDEYRRDIDDFDAPIITAIVDEDVLAMYRNAQIYAYPASELWLWIGARILAARGVTAEQMAADVKGVVQMGLQVGRYVQNSLPWILGYAAMIGVERVGLFGADYTFPGQTAREAERANAEYWVGLTRALGVEVLVPNETTLLNQREEFWLYGYGARPPLAQVPNAEYLQTIITGARWPKRG